MSSRFLPAAFFAILLAACGADSGPVQSGDPVASEAIAPPRAGLVESPRAGLVEYLERELEKADRELPPPLILGGGPGEIGIGRGPSDLPWEGAPAEAAEGK